MEMRWWLGDDAFGSPSDARGGRQRRSKTSQLACSSHALLSLRRLGFISSTVGIQLDENGESEDLFFEP